MNNNGVEPPNSRALILLDFQHDFLADDGRLPVARHQVGPVLEAARVAVDQARGRGDLIIKVGNEFKRADVLGNLFRRRAAVAGSPGTAWDSRIDVDEALYVPKSSGSAFTNPALESALQARGIRTVTIAGLFAKGCVKATPMPPSDGATPLSCCKMPSPAPRTTAAGTPWNASPGRELSSPETRG